MTWDPVHTSSWLCECSSLCVVLKVLLSQEHCGLSSLFYLWCKDMSTPSLSLSLLHSLSVILYTMASVWSVPGPPASPQPVTRHADGPHAELKLVQVRPVLQPPAEPTFHQLIKSFQECQACRPTFFFFSFFTNITETLWYLHALNSHPSRRLHSKSNLANVALSCLLIGSPLWTRESLASGWRRLFRLQRSIGAAMKVPHFFLRVKTPASKFSLTTHYNPVVKLDELLGVSKFNYIRFFSPLVNVVTSNQYFHSLICQFQNFA